MQKLANPRTADLTPTVWRADEGGRETLHFRAGKDAAWTGVVERGENGDVKVKFKARGHSSKEALCIIEHLKQHPEVKALAAGKEVHEFITSQKALG